MQTIDSAIATAIDLFNTDEPANVIAIDIFNTELEDYLTNNFAPERKIGATKSSKSSAQNTQKIFLD